MTKFLFVKEGSAVWISHLDMMRMFQRAFRRAGIPIAMTGGYNPHAFVSIALPLSVGMQSECEILECKLADDTISPQAAAERLNHAGFPEGIRILSGYESDRKIRELKRLRVRLTLEYDTGVPDHAATHIEALLTAEQLVVEKRSKKGPLEIDIRPMVLQLQIAGQTSHTLIIEATICVGEPNLNPELLLRAIERYLPHDVPSFSQIRRLEVMDEQGNIFR